MSESPTSIHRYEIERRIGEGGMGALYLARDPVLDREVAIKLLREGFDNPDLRERFVREAKSAARLTHVNIVRIFDFGDHQGQPFIAMEYIPGETLADKIRRRAQIPLGERLRYIEDLCSGLAHAHKAQIVHRDIKPANVMISPEGELKILDFGIARIGDSKMTQAGMLVGTLNYMSPEQLTGGQVDLRSDIFAVGALSYELLAYRQAFPGGLHDGLLHRILYTAPEPLEKFCPDLDPEIIRIIHQAIEKDPARRYASLTEMERDIEKVRDWLPSEATQIIATPDAATIAIPAPRPTPKPSGEVPAPPAKSPIPSARVPAPPSKPSAPSPLGPGSAAAPRELRRDTPAPSDRTVPIPAVKRPAAAKPPTDPAVHHATRQSEIAALLGKAQQALEQKQFAEAIGAAEAVLLRTPDHAAALALIGRARRERQTAIAQAAADAALAALAAGQIEVAERHIAEGAEADTDHPGILSAHVKVKEARVAAEVERARRAADATERERARAAAAQQQRQAGEARRREDEARRREQEEARRRDEAEQERRRQEAAQRQRDAAVAEREKRVQSVLAEAEHALSSGDPTQALGAIERALEMDPHARVSALRVRAEALRDEQGRAEEGRRQRQRDQRLTAARTRVTTIVQSWPVRIAVGGLLVAVAAAWLWPRWSTTPSPPAPAAESTPAPPVSPPAPAPAAAEPPSALVRARALYAEGKRVEALQVLQASDPALSGKQERGLVDLWLTDARLAVASAAERAIRGGVRPTSERYRAAANRRRDADALRDQGRLADALQAYWEAQSRYDALQPAPRNPPEPANESPGATAPATKSEPAPKVDIPAAPAVNPPAGVPSSPSTVSPPLQPKPAEQPAAPNPQAERDAVLRTVYDFSAAMNNRDANGVRRLRRLSAQEQRRLEDIARGLLAYTYQLTPTGSPTLEGTRASVRCLRQQTFVDGTRRKRNQNDTVLVTLEKEGDRWVIVDVVVTR